MIQINNPCPVSLNQLEKTGENCYFCKKCSEPVIDFRSASESEILAYKGQKICGIFREEQLAHVPVFHWRKAILFRLLTLVSFFGFTVSPVQADEMIPQPTSHVEFSSGQNDKKWLKPNRKRRRKQSSKRVLNRPHYL